MVTHVREEQGVKVTVAGRIDCLRFQQCRRLVQDLASVRSEVQADVQGMVETEWEEFVERKAQVKKLNHRNVKERIVLTLNTGL